MLTIIPFLSQKLHDIDSAYTNTTERLKVIDHVVKSLKINYPVANTNCKI